MNWKVSGAVIIVILLLAGVVVYTRNKDTQNNQAAPATQPPPTMESPNNDWKTFNNGGQNVSFQYPEDLQTKYIRAQEWPPKITVTTDSFSCNEGGQIEGKPLVIRKTMSGTEYCIENVTEGTAGTFYTNYTYTFVNDNKLIKLQFTLAYPQCDNYGDPQKTECENERQGGFDLDALIDRIAQSVNL